VDEKRVSLKVFSRSPTIWINIEFHLSKMHEWVLCFFKSPLLLVEAECTIPCLVFPVLRANRKLYFLSRSVIFFYFVSTARSDLCLCKFLVALIFIFLWPLNRFYVPLLHYWLRRAFETDNQRQCCVVGHNESEGKKSCDDPSTLFKQQTEWVTAKCFYNNVSTATERHTQQTRWGFKLSSAAGW
jgi:hypothetical protein